MVKVHRMHRHNWWRSSKEITTRDCDEEKQTYEVLARRFGFSAEYIQGVLEQYFESPSEAGHRSEDTQPDASQGGQERATSCQWTMQELRNLLYRREVRTLQHDDEIPGIPAGVDALDWYRAREKVKKGDQPPEKRMKKEETEDRYYKDVLFQIYRSSGYGIEDSVHVAYTPHGREIMRYLAKTARGEAEQDAVNG